MTRPICWIGMCGTRLFHAKCASSWAIRERGGRSRSCRSSKPTNSARGETPFPHVYAHNTDAVGLYQILREMYMQVLTHA